MRRRGILLSVVLVTLLAAGVGARSLIRRTACFGGAEGATACAGDGATAGASSADAACDGGATTAHATAKGKDPVMSFVCERSCAAKVAYQEADLAPQPGAKDGDLTRCPVSGVVFEVAARNPSIEYAGHRYRLCCQGCEKKFRADPARFVAS